jgi:hypothetical protein
MGAYFPSPWSAEDGGPARLQMPTGIQGLKLQTGERLACTTRNTLLSTMTVLRAPGEVYLLTHSALRSHLGLPTTARVERIDPVTLRTLEKSPALAGGPMWPGGMAVHGNGSLITVYGRWAHKLDRHCQVRARSKLPLNLPYNSFVLLDNGLIVTKNLSDTVHARLTVLEPEGLRRAAADTECPEPSIARLSSVGNTVYVVGVRSVMRYHWSAATQRLEFDTGWRWDYLSGTPQTYGWDAVLDGDHAWFMDNGRHNYVVRMVGAGCNPTPNRLLRVSLKDARDHAAWEVSGLKGGSVTNPPLVDVQRRIVVAYDSAHCVLRAWRLQPGGDLEPLWQKSNFGAASHMLLYPDTGEFITNDYQRWGEEVVALQIETGQELGRVRSGGITQGVVFPSVGWNRDLYWCSMGRLARIFVATP